MANNFWQRFKGIMGAKTNKVLAKAENIGESLDYAHQKAQDDLRTVTRQLAEVGASKHKLVQQREKAQGRVAKYDTQVRQALQAQAANQANPEAADRAYKMAEAAIADKKTAESEVQRLDVMIADVDTRQGQLVQIKRQHERDVADFGQAKEAVKARAQIAASERAVLESTSGLSNDLHSMGNVLERAVAKIEGDEAQSASIRELQASGDIKRPMDQIMGVDQRDRELAALGGGHADELAAIAASMGLPAAAPAGELPAGDTPSINYEK